MIRTSKATTVPARASTSKPPSLRQVLAALTRVLVAVTLFGGAAWITSAVAFGDQFVVMALAEVPLAIVLGLALGASGRCARLNESRQQMVLHAAIAVVLLGAAAWAWADANPRAAAAAALGMLAAALVAWPPSLAPAARRR